MLRWMEDRYGSSLINQWAELEDSLPLLAKRTNANGVNLVVAHAAPKDIYTEAQISGRDEGTAVGLMWTENRPQTGNSIPEDTLKRNMHGTL